ncbi:MAG: ROK family protein [bacterium]
MVGVDVGGTAIKAGIVDPQGKILEMVERDTEADEEPRKTIERIGKLVLELTRETDAAGVGVGMPGLIDSKKGIVYTSPNLKMWRDVPLREMMESHTKLPVCVGNDVNLAALGEKMYGAGIGRENLILITLGTGVGGGLIINNKLYEGSSGIAGEVGHILVSESGPLCGCGNRGCLESHVGGPRIVERTVGLIRMGWKTSLAERTGGNLTEITPKMIFEEASKGDELARAVAEEVGHYIGIALADLINVFDPEIIIVGGGISAAGDILFSPIRRTVKLRSFVYTRRPIPIVPAKLGNRAGIIGAASLARVSLKTGG